MSAREDVLVKRFGLFVLLLFEIGGGEIVLRLGYVRIVGPETFRVDVDGAFVVRFDFVVFALILTEKSEIVQLLGDIGMRRAQAFLANLQRSFTQRFGLLELIAFA